MKKRRNQIQIKSLYEYIKQIEKNCFPQNTLNNHKVFFRGEANASWKQEGSLFRGKFETDTYTKEVNVLQEKALIDAAKTQCPQAFADCPDAISRMVRMQHYGLPTRLYDVTANPLVALYFACNIEPNEDGKVLFTKAPLASLSVVNTMALLAESIESYEDLLNINRLFDYWKSNVDIPLDEKNVDKLKKWLYENVTKSFLFQPIMDNDRIQRQQGAMIFSSLVSVSPFSSKSKYQRLCRIESYDERMNNILFKKDNVELRYMFEKKEFLVKAEDKKQLLQELDLFGINEGFVYPEVEHQLRTIKYQNIPKEDFPFVADAIRVADEIPPVILEVTTS